MSGHCLLPFSYSEIRLLFLIDGIANRFHVCSYFIYVCLDVWCLFGHLWKNFLEVMFKFFWRIVQNFWNRGLKIENQIFAKLSDSHLSSKPRIHRVRLPHHEYWSTKCGDVNKTILTSDFLGQKKPNIMYSVVTFQILFTLNSDSTGNTGIYL